MSAQTKREPSIVNHFTCSNSSDRNVNETVRRRSFIILMLLLSGNVLPNPGPYNDAALTFKVPADLISRSGLGFIHMNVRSLLPKMDLSAYLGKIYQC